VPRLAEIIEHLERRYPPELASDWDAIGLVVGDPNATITTVLFAVDPVPSVVDEALLAQADLVVTHHPLFLTGVHGVSRTSAKGRMVHDLIAHGVALYVAHTNADHADPGVSDALADCLGVQGTRPIDPMGDSGLGTGRIGTLQSELTLTEFAGRVREQLPPTLVRVAGEGDAIIRTVAVCGGAGDSLLDRVGDADVYVTADLRHHRAQDHRVDGGCALIDVSHWASEWPWLPAAAAALETDTNGAVRTIVSTTPTDPWHYGGQL
jgi:dinuclear metal center YbgI/SA1388 family protein